MGLGYLHGRMVGFIKGSGEMGNKMGEGGILELIKLKGLGNGKMDKELNG